MQQPIRRLLIANRGEIACRVIKTAKCMGIETIAVYSDADADALHTQMADQAIYIGPPEAAKSYLSIAAIITACKDSKADAVHPGYGFLSENPDFARACAKAGIIFIGPSPETMEAMAHKDAAKRLMEAAGVPVTPGYHGKDQNTSTLTREAEKIGYPVLIKAVAGGGGKGMRRVEHSEEFQDALASCQREAKSSFGDDRILIEKYISAPRHIEVQIFGDAQKNFIHLYERDCSLQRRHQKVIEEAPAPGMNPAIRKAMTDAALAAAKAVDYVGAGTVEFIVDGAGSLSEDGFWFMEMNTRLQVEHPVSEMITGLDFVELQIRIAQGEALPRQDDISISGHAMEARLYAEDPTQDFLPSIGPLDILHFPDIDENAKTMRIDHGVVQGGAVSPFYDPMIAKLIAYGDKREDSIKTLSQMCANTHIFPVKTNARFLQSCLKETDFIAGKVSTHFIADKIADLIPNHYLDMDKLAIGAALNSVVPHTPFDLGDGWRLNQPARDCFVRIYQGEEITLPIAAYSQNTGPDKSFALYTHKDGDVVFVDGLAYLIETPKHTGYEIMHGDNLISPMAGKITSIATQIGDQVNSAQTLITMEAMKMEFNIDAPRDGEVAAIHIDVGDLVGDGTLLLELAKQTV